MLIREYENVRETQLTSTVIASNKWKAAVDIVSIIVCIINNQSGQFAWIAFAWFYFISTSCVHYWLFSKLLAKTKVWRLALIDQQWPSLVFNFLSVKQFSSKWLIFKIIPIAVQIILCIKTEFVLTNETCAILDFKQACASHNRVPAHEFLFQQYLVCCDKKTVRYAIRHTIRLPTTFAGSV